MFTTFMMSSFSYDIILSYYQITREQFLLPAFDNSENSRQNQDVGLDGLKNEDEAGYFGSRFLNRLNINATARNQILQDVSGDLFKYYLDENFDQNNTKILERYKKFNGMEGNNKNRRFSSSCLKPNSVCESSLI